MRIGLAVVPVSRAGFGFPIRPAGLETLYRCHKLGSLMANILALATVLFSMNVYDRVIPAQSIPTLWVLAGGVLLAAIFEFSIRCRPYLFVGYYWQTGRFENFRSALVMRYALKIKTVPSPQAPLFPTPRTGRRTGIGDFDHHFSGGRFTVFLIVLGHFLVNWRAIYFG